MSNSYSSIPAKTKNRDEYWVSLSFTLSPVQFIWALFALGFVVSRAEIRPRRRIGEPWTFEGERLEGKLTKDHRVSPDGSPVLLMNGDPFNPEEAEFFLESATQEEMEQLAEGGYDLPPWKEHEESDEYLGIEVDDL